MPHTLNGFIVIVLLLSGLFWGAAHWYDKWQARPPKPRQYPPRKH